MSFAPWNKIKFWKKPHGNTTQVVAPLPYNQPPPDPLATTYGAIGGDPSQKKRWLIVGAILVGIVGLIFGMSWLSSKNRGNEKSLVGSGSGSGSAKPSMEGPSSKPSVASEAVEKRLAAMESKIDEVVVTTNANTLCINGTDKDCELQKRLAKQDRLQAILSGKVRKVERGLSAEKAARKNLEKKVDGHWGWIETLRQRTGENQPKVNAKVITVPGSDSGSGSAQPSVEDEGIEMEDEPASEPPPTTKPVMPDPEPIEVQLP
jgi:hypothetical protein